MTIMQGFERFDYMGETEPVFGWYGTAHANESDLEMLLKVDSERGAIKFMDACSPLFSSGGITMMRTKPSDLPDSDLAPKIAEVMNTAELMRFAVNACRVVNDATVPAKNAMDEIGVGTRYHSRELGERQSPDGLMITGQVECYYIAPLSLEASRGVPGMQTALYGSDGSCDEVYILYGYSGIEGDGDESYRAALADLVDRLFSEALSDVRVASQGLRPSLVSRSYYSFLWYQLLERLTSHDVRICSMCRKPFLANTGAANERGGAARAKAYCSDACRMLAYKSRKAVRRITEEGASVEAAAKAERLSVQKLNLFIEHHPIDGEGVSNG